LKGSENENNHESKSSSLRFCCCHKNVSQIPHSIVNQILKRVFVIYLFRRTFELLITARILGGLGSGVIFILSGVYLKELMGERYNGIIVDLLITQFGLGILLQYILGEFFCVFCVYYEKRIFRDLNCAMTGHIEIANVIFCLTDNRAINSFFGRTDDINIER
jgi:hypothetical protein